MISNKVAASRKILSMTQQELADASSITRPALSVIENGGMPSAETMFKIARVLGKKVDQIFFVNDVVNKQQAEK